MKYVISVLLLLSICMLFCDADGKGKSAKKLTKAAAKGAAALTDLLVPTCSMGGRPIKRFSECGRKSQLSKIRDLQASEEQELINAAASKAATLAKKATSRFFSAWTIISLVMLVIIISVVAYYIHMFYPLVCAERGKYDVMEMAHV